MIKEEIKSAHPKQTVCVLRSGMAVIPVGTVLRQFECVGERLAALFVPGKAFTR
jgi:hypothetical protein